jgi:hypothetical protein
MDLSGQGIHVKLKERKKNMNMQEKGWGLGMLGVGFDKIRGNFFSHGFI